MEIIDTHVHIYPDAIASKAVDHIGDFYKIPMNCSGTVSELETKSSEFDVKKIVVCSVATAPKQVCSINDYMAKQLNNPLFVPIATLHPDMSIDEIKNEVSRIKALGLKGIKLHPDCQKFSLIEKRAYDLFDAIGDFDMPILVHTGDKRFDYSHPSYMIQVAKDFDNLTFIAAHFGGYSEWDDCFNYKGLKNVYFDTSSSLKFLEKEKAVKLINELGPERFMFGTDYPMWKYSDEIPRFLNLGLSDEINELIFSKNAEKLFKLSDN
ncbi:MAG: amidohydrolase family protein [Clostridia bacterium]|nr:amidohydrolase family protein [Clostridia bacterium]